MKELMNIPKKLHVGFQERKNTYTGKLGYIIYTDEKGVKRKEKSWEGWRSNSIAPLDIDNVPTSGLVLNKGVGGARQSYGWNARNEYIRVWDPRDFEFEISVANLLYILQECDCIKGKGLEGEFVYAWSGTELVLLPVTSSEYKTSTDFTSLKSMKVTKKDMVEGHTYTAKDTAELVYLGRLEHREVDRWGYTNDSVQHIAQELSKKTANKSHVFYDIKTNKFRFEKGFTKLAKVSDATCHPDFADYYQKFQDSKYVSMFKEIVLKPITKPEKGTYKSVIIETTPGYFTKIYLTTTEYYSERFTPNSSFVDINDPKAILEAFKSGTFNVSNRRYHGNYLSYKKIATDYPNAKFYTPVSVLESGKEIKDDNYV